MKLRLGAVVVSLAIMLPCASARADARACIAAHEAGIAAKDKGKPLDARPSFVACTNDDCPEAVREECANLLREVERKIASVVISVQGPDGQDVVDGRLSIDGAPVSDRLTGSAIELNPGQHVFEIVHATHGTTKQRALIVEGEKLRRIALAFPRSPSDAPPPAERPPPAVASGGVPVWSYVLGGVGLVALASFGYFAVTGKQKENDLEESCRPKCSPDEVDVMRRRYLIADISLGVSVLALGSAVGVALWSSGDSSADTGASVRVAPSGVSVSGRF